jgi:hypothetical protein
MEAKDVGFGFLAVFSSVMLVYEWLSIYDRVDLGVMFFAGLLTFSISMLLIKNKNE